MRATRHLLLSIGFSALVTAAAPQTPGGLRQATPAPPAAPAPEAGPRPAAPAPPSGLALASRPGDPADSLYRAARAALTGRDYRRAAELFGLITTRYPRSGYAGDAYYWRAFALYRLGGSESLRQALAALELQRRRHPRAATRGDAAALERRIQGELARRGDPEMAEAIAEAAAAAAQIPSPPTPPTPPTPAAPPTPPTPPTPPAPPARPRPSGGGCAGEADDIKVAALNALQQMDPERAAPILRKVLARRDSSSSCLRRQAVFLLSQQGTDAAVGPLLDAARSDPDREVREQAVFWLSQVGTDGAVAALDSILRATGDPDVRDKAVFALSQHGSDRAQAALRAYAARDDVPEDARERAIFWLGQSGEAENAEFLRRLYGRLKSEELKKKVLFSLAQSGTRGSLDWLLNVARDRGEPLELRKQALFWAAQGGASGAELGSLYAAFPDRAMREQLIFALSQRGDRGAADKLVDIARRETDPELRKKALFWLGQMDDPRAAEVLQQIIEE